MATTITLPNGVRIDTTDAVADVVSLLQTQPVQQPKAATTTPQPKAEKATAAPAPKAAKQPRQARQPKAATNGKALWASITTAIAEGDYTTARDLASAKPDTFGVQCEAAITRHEARTAKPSKAVETPKVTRLPEGKRTRKARAANQPKAERHPVLDEVQPEPTKAEKRAAKQQAAKVAAKPRNHKPDCGCVTCPKGVEARKAAKAPKVETPKAVEVAEIAQPIPAPKVVQAADPEGILVKANAECMAMANAMDVDGLKAASKAYLAMTKRQERLGNQTLAEAYADALDCADLAIQMVKEQAAA